MLDPDFRAGMKARFVARLLPAARGLAPGR
jgi:hypothetical protein